MLTNQEKVIVIFLIGASIVGLVVLCYNNAAGPEVTPQVVETADKAQDKSEVVCVDVSGAVWRPGVYRLEEGARVDDVLSKAGLRPDANLDAVNRAASLRDGEKVVVPVKGSPSVSVSASRKKVNINTATEDELQALPHIGEVRSRDIINYRNTHGPFTTKEELKNVPGIGEETFKRLKDLVVAK